MFVVWWYDGRIVRVWQGSGGSDSCCKDGNSDCSMIAVFIVFLVEVVMLLVVLVGL